MKIEMTNKTSKSRHLSRFFIDVYIFFLEILQSFATWTKKLTQPFDHLSLEYKLARSGFNKHKVINFYKFANGCFLVETTTFTQPCLFIVTNGLSFKYLSWLSAWVLRPQYFLIKVAGQLKQPHKPSNCKKENERTGTTQNTLLLWLGYTDISHQVGIPTGFSMGSHELFYLEACWGVRNTTSEKKNTKNIINKKEICADLTFVDR